MHNKRKSTSVGLLVWLDYCRAKKKHFYLPVLKKKLVNLRSSRYIDPMQSDNFVISQNVINVINDNVKSLDWKYEVVQAKEGSYVIRIIENDLESIYCKVACNEAFFEFAIQEKECYEYLINCGLDNLVEFIYADKISNTEFVILSRALRNQPINSIVKFYNKLIDEIDYYMKKTSKYILFNDSDFYSHLQYIRHNIENFPDKELADSVLTYINEYIAEYDGKKVMYSFYYGDCRVENVANNRGKLTWYDFQRGKLTYPLYLDKYHLISHYVFFDADILIRTLPYFDWYDKKSFGEFMLDFFSRFISNGEERSQKHIEWFLESYRKLWFALVV